MVGGVLMGRLLLGHVHGKDCKVNMGQIVRPEPLHEAKPWKAFVFVWMSRSITFKITLVVETGWKVGALVLCWSCVGAKHVVILHRVSHPV